MYYYTMGIVMGMGFIMLVMALTAPESVDRNLRINCEKDLPRSEKCVFIAIPEKERKE